MTGEVVSCRLSPSVIASAAKQSILSLRGAMKDPEWQAFLGKGPGFLEEMHSTIMLPAPHSPLK